MLHNIATTTNNRFYYILYTKGHSAQSEEYSSKIKCIEDFCHNMKNGYFIWGQLVCHHCADEWQAEQNEVILTLNNND